MRLRDANKARKNRENALQSFRLFRACFSRVLGRQLLRARGAELPRRLVGRQRPVVRLQLQSRPTQLPSSAMPLWHWSGAWASAFTSAGTATCRWGVP